MEAEVLEIKLEDSRSLGSLALKPFEFKLNASFLTREKSLKTENDLFENLEPDFGDTSILQVSGIGRIDHSSLFTEDSGFENLLDSFESPKSPLNQTVILHSKKSSCHKYQEEFLNRLEEMSQEVTELKKQKLKKSEEIKKFKRNMVLKRESLEKEKKELLEKIEKAKNFAENCQNNNFTKEDLETELKYLKIKEDETKKQLSRLKNSVESIQQEIHSVSCQSRNSRITSKVMIKSLETKINNQKIKNLLLEQEISKLENTSLFKSLPNESDKSVDLIKQSLNNKLQTLYTQKLSFEKELKAIPNPKNWENRRRILLLELEIDLLNPKITKLESFLNK